MENKSLFRNYYYYALLNSYIDILFICRGKSLLPSHVPINVGDKLKVLYGPNNKESKVTYEAKVLEVDDKAAKMYVHYLGWNTRYDEWVVRERIAQNLTWCQSKGKKVTRAGTPSSKKDDEKKEDSKESVCTGIESQSTKSIFFFFFIRDKARLIPLRKGHQVVQLKEEEVVVGTVKALLLKPRREVMEGFVQIVPYRNVDVVEEKILLFKVTLKF